MKIEFRTKKLEKLCSSGQTMRAKWGPRMAKVIKRRLADLEAAETLEEMLNLPGHCHELSSDRKGTLAVNLVHPYRLLLRPDHNPPPSKRDGGLDWKRVTRIEVEEVLDYH